MEPLNLKKVESYISTITGGDDQQNLNISQNTFYNLNNSSQFLQENTYHMLKSKIIPYQSIKSPKKAVKKQDSTLEKTLKDVLLLQNRGEQEQQMNQSKDFFISKKTREQFVEEFKKKGEKDDNLSGLSNINNHFIRLFQYEKTKEKIQNQNASQQKNNQNNKKNVENLNNSKIDQGTDYLNIKSKYIDIHSLESFGWRESFLEGYKKQVKLKPLCKLKKDTQQLNQSVNMGKNEQNKIIKKQVNRRGNSVDIDSRRISVEEIDEEKQKNQKQENMKRERLKQFYSKLAEKQENKREQKKQEEENSKILKLKRQKSFGKKLISLRQMNNNSTLSINEKIIKNNNSSTLNLNEKFIKNNTSNDNQKCQLPYKKIEYKSDQKQIKNKDFIIRRQIRSQTDVKKVLRFV